MDLGRRKRWENPPIVSTTIWISDVSLKIVPWLSQPIFRMFEDTTIWMSAASMIVPRWLCERLSWPLGMSLASQTVVPVRRKKVNGVEPAKMCMCHPENGCGLWRVITLVGVGRKGNQKGNRLLWRFAYFDTNPGDRPADLFNPFRFEKILWV